MYSSILIAAGLLGLAQAQSYTPPGAETFGSLYTPDGSDPVTQGQTYKVTWDASGTTAGETVSLVLCHGPSTNCVNAPNAIVSGIPASQAYYEWSVPCSLAPGVQSTATGYGMLIIVDGTGQFQYSTQFSVLAGSSCAATTTTTTTTTTTSSSTSSSTTSSSSSSVSTASSITSSKTSSTTGSVAPTGPSTWLTWSASNNYTMTSIKPTGPSSVKVTSTAPATLTYATTTSSASPSPSLFHGAANKIGGSAAALVLAAGAAFLGL